MKFVESAMKELLIYSHFIYKDYYQPPWSLISSRRLLVLLETSLLYWSNKLSTLHFHVLFLSFYFFGKAKPVVKILRWHFSSWERQSEKKNTAKQKIFKKKMKCQSKAIKKAIEYQKTIKIPESRLTNVLNQKCIQRECNQKCFQFVLIRIAIDEDKSVLTFDLFTRDC